MNNENYKEKYEKAFEWAQSVIKNASGAFKEDLEHFFPELKESEDERIRKELIDFVHRFADGHDFICANGSRVTDVIAWLEKQKESNWRPSKEVMDVLYALCYITDKIDDNKDTILTRLYQDLKREFFNGASYENMFPKEEKQKSVEEIAEKYKDSWFGIKKVR